MIDKQLTDNCYLVGPGMLVELLAPFLFTLLSRLVVYVDSLRRLLLARLISMALLLRILLVSSTWVSRLLILARIR